jgi:hypothetical protein
MKCLPFKIYFYGKFNIKRRYLDPNFSIIDICDDITYKTTHRWYQLAWLGLSINLERVIKNNTKKPVYFISIGRIIKRLKKLI